MSIEFTQRRDESLGLTPDGREANLEWDAYPASSSAAVQGDDEFPVEINAPFPGSEGSRLRCDRITVTRVGGRLFRVAAHWSIPIRGQDRHNGQATQDDPLREPTIIRWQDIQYTEPVDRDIDGNPILNSARRAFRDSPQRVFNAKRVTMTRNEPSFDISAALNFENTVNNSVFEGALPGELKCVSIVPTNVITVESVFTEVTYTFEYRSRMIWGNDPHQPRILDQGFESPATVDGQTRIVRLVDVKGQPPESEVPLDGQGRPFRPDDFTYLDENGMPVASPTFVSIGAPVGATVELTDDAAFLRYATYPGRDFNELQLP